MDKWLNKTGLLRACMYTLKLWFFTIAITLFLLFLGGSDGIFVLPFAVVMLAGKLLPHILVFMLVFASLVYVVMMIVRDSIMKKLIISLLAMMVIVVAVRLEVGIDEYSGGEYFMGVLISAALAWLMKAPGMPNITKDEVATDSADRS